MVKPQAQKQNGEKTCFGTKEWSDNSGICRGCKFKVDCGKKARKE